VDEYVESRMIGVLELQFKAFEVQNDAKIVQLTVIQHETSCVMS